MLLARTIRGCAPSAVAGDLTREHERAAHAPEARSPGCLIAYARGSEERACALGRYSRAFTLIEILIVVVILGILAAIVIPHFSNASTLARENTMKDELRYLRTQIIVYKAQHEDVPAGYAADGTTDASLFTSQMTQYTSAKGETASTADATHTLGPYLSQMPANPVNGKSDVKIVTSSIKDAADDTTGWIYNPQTLEIIANIKDKTGSDGVAYVDY